MKLKYYYQIKYNLLVIPNPNSTYGTTTGSGRYEKGTTVSISAIPNTGYKFLLWREGESIANPRNVVVNGDFTYNALFYKESTGELKIVDTDLNLYSYNEYDALTTKPSVIGVALLDGNDWLVYYKNYVGTNGDGIIGYRLGSDELLPSDPFTPLPVADLIYPHSGKNSSDLFKNKYGDGYAAYIVGQLTDGGLSWYIPNLYEYTLIFNRTLDSLANAHDGFDSHFTLIQCPLITKSSVVNDHAHWSCDVGYGGGVTAGVINPYRVTFLNTTNQPAYCTSGNYTYANNYNYVRPVARLLSQTILYLSDNTIITLDNTQLTKNLISNRYKNNLIRCDVGTIVTSIETDTFRDCTLLLKVIIPSSVTSMGSNVFDDCSLLTSINIPNSITSFGSYTFYKCSGLTNITIPNLISSISYGLFFRCSGLTSIAIPDNITSIGGYAFSDCTGLTSLTIPNSITSIGDYAFGGCTGLSSIIMESTVPPTLGDSVFSGTNDCPIYVPSGYVSVYLTALGWSSYSSRILAIPTT